MPSKVQVLMSTYNGQTYLREQIDSILKQDHTHINLLIRDDGSTDDTIRIIKEYSEKCEKIKYYTGENCGTCYSFFDLIQKADKSADYYAFSDQDDYWMSNKISRAVNVLENESKHHILMYASNAIIVNSNLEEIQTHRYKRYKKPGFKNAVLENICIGCSIVINKELYNAIVNKIPKKIYMHDWWLYLVTSSLGKVLYDNNAFLLYRQHNNNVIGIKRSFEEIWRTRIKNYNLMCSYRNQQLIQLNELYQLDNYKKEIINDLLLTKDKFHLRIKIVMHNEIFRQSFIDSLIFKLIILIRGF